MKKYTDFSQLNASQFLPPTPEPDDGKPGAPPDADAQVVLDYFSKPKQAILPKSAHRKESPRISQTVPNAHAPCLAKNEQRRTDAEQQIREADRQRSEAEQRANAAEQRRTEAEQRLAEAERRHADAYAQLQRETNRLQNECTRLRDEAERAAQAAAVLPTPPPAPHVQGLLNWPVDRTEAFPGEWRELVLSVLADARDACRQSGRERRAQVLSALLAANRPSGELERRRNALVQILKDCDYKPNAQALAHVGLKLVSGRNHWKFDYAALRVTIAKTPSDYRAIQNTAKEIAKRCF